LRLRTLFHPITVFILSLLALGMSLFLYIHWYLKAASAFNAFVEKYGLQTDQILEGKTWVVILTLSILVGIILFGILIIFLYYQKVIALYKQQQNFINGFTHELKTPVASLKLYLDTFKKHELSREAQIKYLNYMLADVERLSGNVGRILNLAKIEDKRHLGEFHKMNVYDFLKEILDSNAHMFPSDKVQLEEPTYPEGLNLPIITAPFEIMLLNLIQNGLTYNDSPRPFVSIKFESHKHDLVIKISDNGIGISKNERKKIFKKFYQIGNAAKGNGLGLFLVMQIVKLHGGKIWIEEGIDGKGSVFVLVFPRRISE